MSFKLEEVFRTEGVPEYTYVNPPNYNQILIDVRNATKPVIVEGQSGTGKTVTVLNIIQKYCASSNFQYLSARKGKDLLRITKIVDENIVGKYIIDDFHRLELGYQQKVGELIKVAAEEGDPDSNSKYVIIGINRVGSALIQLVHDIAKRCGIHKVSAGTDESIRTLVQSGEQKLNVTIGHYVEIYNETRGDYWLTQLFCQNVCLGTDVLETKTELTVCGVSFDQTRRMMIERLDNAYSEPVVEFCRGKRFRATNDPYFKLLQGIARQENSIVDLTEMANGNPDIKGSINNIKERRLTILLESKPICERYFYYDQETKFFAIEDPALFYYIRNTDWEGIREKCGFRQTVDSFSFDFAISFAGENRDLASRIVDQLLTLDCSVFYDELFESNFLGKAWHAEFTKIFSAECRFIVCLLDKNHVEKIWPTFERECFLPRVKDEAVFPIYLDDTPVPGIPKDVVGIMFKNVNTGSGYDNEITDRIVYKIVERLESE